MDMFQHMIDANEKLKKALMDEFGKSNHQELQEIINFIKDLIIGKVNIYPFGIFKFFFIFMLYMIPYKGEMHSIQHNVIKFVSDLRQVGGGCLRVLRFPPP
jgi:hypothetical protein